MPKSKKPAKRGIKSLLPGAKAPGFQPMQSRLPKGLKSGKGVTGGKPKLFPGRTGSR